MAEKGVVVIRSDTGSHIVGRCLHCKKTHDGLLSIGVNGIFLEIGVSEGDYFHPIERMTLQSIAEEMERQD